MHTRRALRTRNFQTMPLPLYAKARARLRKLT
jgi:hypothetical protein